MPSSIAPLAEFDEETIPDSIRNSKELISSGTQQRDEERSHALRLLSTEQNEHAFTLPILATAGDVREAVQYLKKKPAGVSIAKALADAKKRVFEPRKIAAYEFWGIVRRPECDRLQLTRLGWEFARKLAPEAEAYRVVLDQTAPYRAALEWIARESLDLVTHKDVAAFWQKHSFISPVQNEKLIEASVVCFFHLCQAAEVGTVTIGKRGQPARLRVEREELCAYIECQQTTEAVACGPSEAAISNFASSSEKVAASVNNSKNASLLIACGAATRALSHLQATVELMGIEHRTIFVSEVDVFPCADEMCKTMRECAAGVVIVTPEDCQTDDAGAYVLKQQMLHFINTSFVLYDRRVALLWDKSIPFPARLSALPNFTLDECELKWETGVQLMRVLKKFQEQARESDSRALRV